MKGYNNEYPWKAYINDYSKKLNWSRPDNKYDILHDKRGKIINHPLDDTKVFYSKKASSNTLLKNVQRRDALKELHEVSAVEMESSGIAAAAWEEDCGYIAVRGICDYCDEYKDDKWQDLCRASCSGLYACIN